MNTRKVMLYAALVASLTAGTVIAGTSKQQVQAKAKVTYTLKNGTLTIKGKGAMPSKMTFKKNQKIKKVVIKKGVTSISNEAFFRCKNLKSVSISSSVKTIGYRSFYETTLSRVTIPSKTKTIGQEAFGNCKSLKSITIPGNFKLKLDKEKDDQISYVTDKRSGVDTVTFNTNLKLTNVSYLSANNLIVAKSDPSYQSIDGIIYTKNGNGIVRVPQKREELVIKEGCKEFNLQSVLYNSIDSEGDQVNWCSNLKKITIPSSIQSVNISKYKTDRYNAYDVPVSTMDIKVNNLDAKSLYALGSTFDNYFTFESLMKLLPDQITYKDYMYLTTDHALLKYDGKEENVIIPEDITWIAPKAFYNIDTMKSVKIPSKITTIEDYTFYGCDKLGSIVIPDQVTTIGESAFDTCTQLKSVTFGKSVKWIKKNAFATTQLKDFTIPSTIDKVEKYAFSAIDNIGSVTFEGSTKNVSSDAFINSNKITLVYKKGIKEAQTGLSYDYIEARKNGNNKVCMTWQKISNVNGYQLKFSTDKKFKKVLKTVTVKKNATSVTTYVKNKKKTLYIRIRPYQTINKKKVYGRYSSLQLW